MRLRCRPEPTHKASLTFTLMMMVMAGCCLCFFSSLFVFCFLFFSPEFCSNEKINAFFFNLSKNIYNCCFLLKSEREEKR